MAAERGIGIKVNARTPFTRVALDALAKAAETTRPVSCAVTRSDFVGSKLGELFSEFRVGDIFMEASAEAPRVKLAAIGTA